MGEATPKTLGRYQIQEEIGRGMMGVVYRAFDPALGRTVALKTIHLALSGGESEESFERRFLTEARVAAVLSHPGIVVVHDVGRDPETGTLFIALEFLEGRSLSDMVADGKPMEWRQALRLAAQLAEALHHAHANGVVHRDVKPANVMVLPSGAPKIMDFGIAKVSASQLTAAGEFFGTPLYMSPEQARGDAVDGRSDLFSLGSILYLLLTGKRAFEASNVPAILARVAGEDPPPPSRLVPGLPPAVDAIVARALAKRPEQRYQDGRSLAQDIEDVLTGRPAGRRREATLAGAERTAWVSVSPVAERETSDLRLESRRRGLATAALAGALVVGLGAWVVLHERPGSPPGPTVADSPTATSSPAPSAPGASPALGMGEALLRRLLPEPAHVEILFEHSLKSGTIKVWLDDEPAFEERLSSRVTHKIGPITKRQGVFRKVLDVPAGEHTIKVQVRGDDFSGVSRVRTRFQNGEVRRLQVNREGLPLFGLDKELALEWY